MTELKTKEGQKEVQKELILGLDVSTSCIGVCLFLDDKTPEGKIVTLTQISPKLRKRELKRKVTGIETLFLKKRLFGEFIREHFGKYDIRKIVIEEPLLGSNNINTVATLLRFNGMVSDMCYDIFCIAPEFISSHDARQYSFPDLLSIRKLNKNGEIYPENKIKSALKHSEVVLFGDYSFDIDKKQVMMDRVNEKYPDITWEIDTKGEFRKENYDACDSLVAVLGYLNKLKYDGTEAVVKNVVKVGNGYEYDMDFADLTYHKKITLD